MTTNVDNEPKVSKDRVVPYVKGRYDLKGFAIVGNRDFEGDEEDLGISRIFLEDDKPIGVAILSPGDDDLYINYMEAIEHRKGYGSRMVTLLKNLPKDFATIEGESGHVLRGFWERHGAVYEDVERYEFVIDLKADRPNIE